MLWVSRSETGQILATCEWHLVNEVGHLVADGRYVWVQQFELSDGASVSQAMRALIRDLTSQCPWAVAAYWKREDKLIVPQVQFRRETFVRYAEQEVMASHG